MEPGDGLHEGQSRLQALLRRNLRRTLARDSGAIHTSRDSTCDCGQSRVDMPLMWKRPRTIFVNSMSDLFHEKVPLSFIHRVFETMEKASWHTFQVLTKRSKRLADLAPDLNWPPNVWMGVSIETANYLWRADHLRQV